MHAHTGLNAAGRRQKSRRRWSSRLNTQNSFQSRNSTCHEFPSCLHLPHVVFSRTNSSSERTAFIGTCRLYNKNYLGVLISNYQLVVYCEVHTLKLYMCVYSLASFPGLHQDLSCSGGDSFLRGCEIQSGWRSGN